MPTAQAVALTTAPPETIWKMWTDVESSPRWDVDVEWSRLDGAFAVGARGAFKLKKGGKLSFVLDEVVKERSYANTVRFLPGVTLRFTHVQEPVAVGASRVTHGAEIRGPLGLLLRPLLRRPLQAALSRALGNMVRLAESVSN